MALSNFAPSPHIADRIPKAELHVHLEGAIPISTIQRLARKNGISLSGNLFDGNRYNWKGFPEFLRCYDAAAEALRTEDDFSEATYAYLRDSAGEGVCYAEIIISPTHADRLGLGYPAYLRGICDGCARAESDHNIVSRLIAVIVRHESHDAAKQVITHLEKHHNLRVTGFHIAGNEDHASLKDYQDYFREAQAMGLGIAAHAGEIRGPREVWIAIDELGVSRIGHGISSAEDPVLMSRLAKDKICLEVCPSSNIAIGGRCTTFADHPLRVFYDEGIPVTVNSDDPPFFNTTIGKEYQVAHDHFAFSSEELVKVTQTALDHAFVDDDTKQQLRKRVADAMSNNT